jgi:uncharacterized NAD-dependent epimerase/dehydratase family protein
MSSPRYLILAEGRFGPLTSKTANSCIRYTPDNVVGVVDSHLAGRTVQEVLGFGGAIPVVASVSEGLVLHPNALLIGVAPQGGQLPPEWRAMVLAAIDAGLDVWSGLHTFIGDDAEFSARAARRGVTVHDLRKPPADLPVATGRVREVDATVILTVGTDCNIGKMTAALQVRDALRARGHAIRFAGTGQTGILIEGWGIAVDAVIADFIAGAAEQLVLQAAEGTDIVLVEGQGSLVHPGYSGVSLGLLHGSLPHAMVMCDQPSRTTVNNNPWVPIPSLPDAIRLHETVLGVLRPAPVIAVSLNTFDLTEPEARDAITRACAETGLPTTDPVRFDPAPIADAIAAFHAERVKQPRG